MFDSLVKQPGADSLVSDIQNNTLPGALLFSGESSSGKLTAAIETYRVLSCREREMEKGRGDCQCKSCARTRSLIVDNLLLLGPGDCILEIAAAGKAFMEAAMSGTGYITDARYFFIRSIRKLTLRFNIILWKGEPGLSKIGTVIEDIDENLEKLDVSRPLPPLKDLGKICDKLMELTSKLENDFLYDSIPISQIRNMEEWAHIKTEEGRKVIVIENSDRMMTGARNALLKILEEPPSDCLFILLTSKRSAIMETILSRVRTYNFVSPSDDVQQTVIRDVFHASNFNGGIGDYLLTFLPVPPMEIKKQADIFYNSIAARQIPDIGAIVKGCGSFHPRQELRLFITCLMDNQKALMKTQQGAEFCMSSLLLFRQCVDNITLYNQTPTGALEILLRDFSALNVQNGGIMRICEDM